MKASDSERPSKAEVDRLGERIRESPEPELVDLQLLQAFILAHDIVLAETEVVVRESVGEATSRLKTQGTLIDKLRRQSSRLSQIQDIAGIRVVRDMTLGEQDALVEQLLARLPEARVIDRRRAPTHGYRAVHLVVRVQGFRVEIQVRTRLQHLWAEVIERIGDVYGRGIRYGEAPEDPDMPVSGGLTRAEVVQGIIRSSGTVAKTEELRMRLSEPISAGIARDRLIQRQAEIEGELKQTFERTLTALTRPE